MSNKASMEMYRYENERRDLSRDVHDLQEWLGQADDPALVEKLARALEEKEKRLDLARANVFGWQMAREGRSLLRALSGCKVPPSLVNFVEMLEDAVDAWEGVQRCAGCRKVFDSLIECESGYDFDWKCPDCHANGTRPEHHGLARGSVCAECVHDQLLDSAKSEAADLGDGDLH